MQDPQTRLLIRRACRAVLAVNTLGLATAVAQPADLAPAADEPIAMERIVVTGSLIPQIMEVNSPAPVEVLSAADLDRMNIKALEDFTRKLPSSMGAGNFGSARGNGGDGSSSISLRGVPGGTLVLVNGRRMPGVSTGGGGRVDLNTIPMAAVERVEVLLDGGSAIYGADAVAGVVNFITRKDFTGTEFGAYYGNTTDKDMGRQNYSFITGHSDGDASFMVSGSFYKQNDLMSQDRDRSRADIGDPRNTSPTGNPGWIQRVGGQDVSLIYGGPIGPWPTDPTDPRYDDYWNVGNFREFNSATDRFPYPNYTPAVRPEERYNFFGTGEKVIYGENLKFFAEGTYTHIKSYNQLAPTPIYFPYQIDEIPASNPYNLFGEPVQVARYRTVELGPRTENIEGDSFRIVTGLNGQMGDSALNWEVAFNYGRDSRQQVLGGELSGAALARALADTDPVTAFNPFGYQANSGAQLAGVSQDLITLYDSQLAGVDGKVYGDIIELPAGMLGTAWGVSYYDQRLSQLPDGAQRQGDTVGFNSSQPLNGVRQFTSVFSEFRVPLASPDMGIPAINSFEVGVALRFDNYSDFGNTWNPKVNIRWKPINDDFTLRGSYSTSFVPPSFGDLYLLDQESYPELRNPARGAIETVSDPNLPTYNPASPDFEAGYNSTAFPTFEQVRTIYSGNPDLEPETSENFTAGMVWTPRYVKNLTVSVDWFKIEQENIPGSVDQFLLDNNFNGADPNLTARQKPTDPNAPFAANVDYDPGLATYTTLYAPTFNLSQRAIEGVDFRIGYDIPTPTAGTFSLGLDITHYYRFEQENLPGEGYTDRLGGFVDPTQGFGLGTIVRWKGNFSAFWMYRDFEVGGILYYIDDYRDDPQVADRDVESWLTLDLQASYNFPRDLRVTVGVQNVTDEAPPLVVGAFSDNYDRDTHNLIGRFVYGQVTKKF